MGFFTIGLLYGQRDFGTSLCAAVNCGYDAEVIGGAMGAIMGILRGSSGLPEAWVAPIGDLVIPGLGMRDYDAPLRLTEVVDRTVAVGRRVIAARCPDVALRKARSLRPHPRPLRSFPPHPCHAASNSRFADLDLTPNASEASALDPDTGDRATRRAGRQQRQTHSRNSSSSLLPNSPLAAETLPPVNMPVAPGEALPYMQPAQANEQPIATDPDLIERAAYRSADEWKRRPNAARRRARSSGTRLNCSREPYPARFLVRRPLPTA